MVGANHEAISNQRDRHTGVAWEDFVKLGCESSQMIDDNDCSARVSGKVLKQSDIRIEATGRAAHADNGEVTRNQSLTIGRFFNCFAARSVAGNRTTIVGYTSAAYLNDTMHLIGPKNAHRAPTWQAQPTFPTARSPRLNNNRRTGKFRKLPTAVTVHSRLRAKDADCGPAPLHPRAAGRAEVARPASILGRHVKTGAAGDA